jgi:hypothetical protein
MSGLFTQPPWRRQKCVQIEIWDLSIFVPPVFRAHATWSRTCKQFFVQAIKACRGSRGLAPLTLKLSTRWRSIVSLRPRPLYPQEKHLCYSLNWRQGGPHRLSRCLEGEKKLSPVLGVEIRTVQPLAFSTPRIFVDLNVCSDDTYLSSAEVVHRWDKSE